MSALIPLADLIISEALMLTEGVHLELELIYAANRWDRTVLVLPPLQSPLATIDNDPVVQMFPRCIWADSFHTESLVDSPILSDLLARINAITSLPEAERRKLIDPAARHQAYPIDLLPVARYYESSAMWASLQQDSDDRVRYYGFWQLFRATAIRGVAYLQGDKSFENRRPMADAYIQMSAIMLDNHPEGERFVLEGDLTFADQCLQSAWNFIRDDDPPRMVELLRNKAEEQFEALRVVQTAIQNHPDRFIIRPRYGPIRTRAQSRRGHKTSQ